MTRRYLSAAILSGSLLSLAASFLLARQVIVFGSYEGGWFYPYVSPFYPRALEVFAIAAVLSVWALNYGWQSGAEWRTVLCWCFGGLGLQALLRSLTPFSFHDIFASDGANSFFSVALKVDAATLLRQFETLRASWPLHAQSNLPGKLLLVRALTHISRDPGTLAWLVVLISNLGGVFLYVFVRDLLKDRRAALVALALYLFMPGKLFFFPLLNTVTPVVAIACAWALVRWLSTGRMAYAAILGVGVYALTLFEPGALVIGLLFATLIVHAAMTGAVSPMMLARQALAGAAAFAASYAVMKLLLGFDLGSALTTVANDAVKFNVQAARPYEVWIRQNLIDFAFSIGICQTIVAAAVVVGWARIDSGARPAAMPAFLLTLSLGTTLAAVDLIGVNRGEVTRLWIFLGCFFQIPAAYVSAKLDSPLAAGLIVTTTLLQDALGCAMVGFIVPG